MVVTRSGKETSLDASGSTCTTSTTEAVVSDTVSDNVSNSATSNCTVSADEDKSGTVVARCPFCKECFQRLGSHLRHCKQ